ncbi:MAG: hypothetical protein WEA81_03725, partial [Dehalococcoidia bacterium]
MDLFLGAKAAEAASPKTITWYRMILERAHPQARVEEEEEEEDRPVAHGCEPEQPADALRTASASSNLQRDRLPLLHAREGDKCTGRLAGDRFTGRPQ